MRCPRGACRGLSDRTKPSLHLLLLHSYRYGTVLGLPLPCTRIVAVQPQPGFRERRYPYQKNSHVLARGPRGAIVRRSRVRPPKPCMTTPRHATPTTYTCTWPSYYARAAPCRKGRVTNSSAPKSAIGVAAWRRTLVVRRVCRTDDFQESLPHAHLEGAHCLNEYVQTLSSCCALAHGSRTSS